jgi:hypothetical protein
MTGMASPAAQMAIKANDAIKAAWRAQRLTQRSHRKRALRIIKDWS